VPSFRIRTVVDELPPTATSPKSCDAGMTVTSGRSPPPPFSSTPITAQSTAASNVPSRTRPVGAANVCSTISTPDRPPPLPARDTSRTVHPCPAKCSLWRIATAPNTTASPTVVARSIVYAAVSVPPSHGPWTATVFFDSTEPIGSAGSAPEYRATRITELLGAPANVAVTSPAAFAPCAIQTSAPVCPRAPHCARTRVQVAPMPVTPVTVSYFLAEIAAR
jgi:hypothetical protein